MNNLTEHLVYKANIGELFTLGTYLTQGIILVHRDITAQVFKYFKRNPKNLKK